MNTDTTTSLGPQCLSCKKRQVKCDSTPIACLRCAKDNVKCPGYKKRLKWKQFEAPKRPGAKLQLVKSESGENDTIELIRKTPRQDRELALVLDSVEYFNTHVVPYMSPAHAPFQRSFVPAEYWHLFPTVLKHTWIVICKTSQCGKTASDPALNSELCYYRGRSLSGLQKMLCNTGETTTDPHASALSCVLFVMGADMQLCESHWTTHLEAARRIIAWRGGLQKCLLNPCTHDAPLINYFYADIMTATSCNVWQLNPRALQSQFEYLTVIPEQELKLVAYGHPCPQQILQAIACTTILRVFLQRPLTEQERELVLSYPIEFDSIHELISSFDPATWAISFSNLGRALPQKVEEQLGDVSIACLVLFGESFRSAALLYLYLSTQLIGADSPAVISAKESLSDNLRKLFDMADVDHNGPLSAQLWRFTMWPIVISGYAKAGWDVGGESIEIDLDRLDAIVSRHFTRRLHDAGKLLREVQQMRLEMSGERVFRWDDGFNQRKAYVV